MLEIPFLSVIIMFQSSRLEWFTTFQFTKQFLYAYSYKKAGQK